MLVGIINLITGKRLIIYLLFLNGLIFFTSFVVIIATETLLLKSQDVRKLRMIWIGVCAIFFGLIGGLLCCRFYRFGLGVMGLLMGIVIGEVISHAANLENKWVLTLSWGIGIVLAIVSAIFVDVMIIINTSFIGAQAFMSGIDYIVDKGYTYLIGILINNKPIEHTPTLWGMLASSILLNLLGILIQYKAYKNTQYYKINVKK
ncbi:hypothetical protein CONCODRAFT_7106 [Conidiobolus coronatus NRRL 28638]|uniref:Transmembrane protein 198 n=1 Tax=Conidiobolus coronatus (strain ATCC 28846 / CBS 209.66 / NRRL 28638) TaxID=796925 RepID=A0A137P5Q6_CONC2|nr:hypothetical protein CONCODRAFT_7106 [Conidiobolus coronatus NRRL 28638]|eukprot:KXN70348.1 hypothetical protein CONCODRAFT_7106 [Conidiobolus coronatus NRRL 28638]